MVQNEQTNKYANKHTLHFLEKNSGDQVSAWFKNRSLISSAMWGIVLQISDQ